MNVLDLTFLTEKEREWIIQVLARDEEIEKREEARIQRLRNKAARTNNQTIQKKIKMRSGDWFLELTEKQRGIKRTESATATLRASLRPSQKKSRQIKSQTPLIEVHQPDSVESLNNQTGLPSRGIYHSLDRLDRHSDGDISEIQDEADKQQPTSGENHRSTSPVSHRIKTRRLASSRRKKVKFDEALLVQEKGPHISEGTNIDSNRGSEHDFHETMSDTSSQSYGSEVLGTEESYGESGKDVNYGQSYKVDAVPQLEEENTKPKLLYGNTQHEYDKDSNIAYTVNHDTASDNDTNIVHDTHVNEDAPICQSHQNKIQPSEDHSDVLVHNFHTSESLKSSDDMEVNKNKHHVVVASSKSSLDKIEHKETAESSHKMKNVDIHSNVNEDTMQLAPKTQNSTEPNASIYESPYHEVYMEPGSIKIVITDPPQPVVKLGENSVDQDSTKAEHLFEKSFEDSSEEKVVAGKKKSADDLLKSYNATVSEVGLGSETVDTLVQSSDDIKSHLHEGSSTKSEHALTNDATEPFVENKTDLHQDSFSKYEDVPTADATEQSVEIKSDLNKPEDVSTTAVTGESNEIKSGLNKDSFAKYQDVPTTDVTEQSVEIQSNLNKPEDVSTTAATGESDKIKRDLNEHSFAKYQDVPTADGTEQSVEIQSNLNKPEVSTPDVTGEGDKIGSDINEDSFVKSEDVPTTDVAEEAIEVKSNLNKPEDVTAPDVTGESDSIKSDFNEDSFAKSEDVPTAIVAEETVEIQSNLNKLDCVSSPDVTEESDEINSNLNEDSFAKSENLPTTDVSEEAVEIRSNLNRPEEVSMSELTGESDKIKNDLNEESFAKSEDVPTTDVTDEAVEVKSDLNEDKFAKSEDVATIDISEQSVEIQSNLNRPEDASTTDVTEQSDKIKSYLNEISFAQSENTPTTEETQQAVEIKSNLNEDSFAQYENALMPDVIEQTDEIESNLNENSFAQSKDFPTTAATKQAVEIESHSDQPENVSTPDVAEESDKIKSDLNEHLFAQSEYVPMPGVMEQTNEIKNDLDEESFAKYQDVPTTDVSEQAVEIESNLNKPEVSTSDVTEESDKSNSDLKEDSFAKSEDVPTTDMSEEAVEVKSNLNQPEVVIMPDVIGESDLNENSFAQSENTPMPNETQQAAEVESDLNEDSFAKYENEPMPDVMVQEYEIKNDLSKDFFARYQDVPTTDVSKQSVEIESNLNRPDVPTTDITEQSGKIKRDLNKDPFAKSEDVPKTDVSEEAVEVESDLNEDKFAKYEDVATIYASEQTVEIQSNLNKPDVPTTDVTEQSDLNENSFAKSEDGPTTDEPERDNVSKYYNKNSPVEETTIIGKNWHDEVIAECLGKVDKVKSDVEASDINDSTETMFPKNELVESIATEQSNIVEDLSDIELHCAHKGYSIESEDINKYLHENETVEQSKHDTSSNHILIGTKVGSDDAATNASSKESMPVAVDLGNLYSGEPAFTEQGLPPTDSDFPNSVSQELSETNKIDSAEIENVAENTVTITEDSSKSNEQAGTDLVEATFTEDLSEVAAKKTEKIEQDFHNNEDSHVDLGTSEILQQLCQVKDKETATGNDILSENHTMSDNLAAANETEFIEKADDKPEQIVVPSGNIEDSDDLSPKTAPPAIVVTDIDILQSKENVAEEVPSEEITNDDNATDYKISDKSHEDALTENNNFIVIDDSEQTVSDDKDVKPVTDEVTDDAAEERDKIEELSNAINFLQKVEATPAKQSDFKPDKKKILGRSTPNLRAPSALKPSFGSSWSVNSAATSAVRSDLEITGTIELSFKYSYQDKTFKINVGSCKDLAAAEKKKLSNPYVKTYLLPDKHSKRKTKAKKKTLNPVYNETLKYIITETELATRTLNVAVWHDKVGVNIFLGEVNISMATFDTSLPEKMEEYRLLPKEILDSGSDTQAYLGEIEVALRLTTEGVDGNQLEIVMKSVHDLVQAKGSMDVYVKCYFLPDKGHETKQKTPIVSGKGEMTFDHLFAYTNIVMKELQQHCVEMTVWQQKLGANRILGGTRIGPGTGMSYNEPVSWMDSTGREVDLWHKMINNAGRWVDGFIALREIDPKY